MNSFNITKMLRNRIRVNIFKLVFVFLTMSLNFVQTGCKNNITKSNTKPDKEIFCPNGEGTWQLIGLQDEEITAIAMDPFDENIIYVGSDLYAGEWGGLFKSTDGGASWDTLNIGIAVSDIDIHPFDPRILYVIRGRIFKTTDGGVSWIQADSGIRMTAQEGPGVLAIDPARPEILYVGTSGFLGGNLYKSTNGGRSWQAIGNNVLHGGVTAFAIDANNTKVLYAGTAAIGAVFKSSDGGKSWQRLDLPELGIIHDLAVHPFDSEIVYAGTWRYGFYFSMDAGVNWQSANTGLPDTSYVQKILICENQIYIAAYGRGIGAVYKSPQDNIEWSMVGKQGFPEGINTLSIASELRRLYVGAIGIFLLSDSADNEERP